MPANFDATRRQLIVGAAGCGLWAAGHAPSASGSDPASKEGDADLDAWSKIPVSLKLIDEGCRPDKGLLRLAYEIRSLNGGHWLFNPWMFQIRREWKSISLLVYDDQNRFVRSLEDRDFGKSVSMTRQQWTSVRSACYVGITHTCRTWALWRSSAPQSDPLPPRREYRIQAVAYDRLVSRPPEFDSFGIATDKALAHWLRVYTGKEVARSNSLRIRFGTS